MAIQQVICVNHSLAADGTQYHISDLGLSSPAGWRERITIQQVVAQLRFPFGGRTTQSRLPLAFELR